MWTMECHITNNKGSFSKLLFDSQHPGKTATRVEINQLNDAALDISIWSDNELIQRKIYSRDKEEFGCSENFGIKLSLGFGVGGYGHAWGIGQKVAFLNKSIDNSLIVRTSTDSGFFWYPTGDIANMWYRFPPFIKQ